MEPNEDDVVMLTGAKGIRYKCEPMSPLSLRRLRPWIMEQRITAFLVSALKFRTPASVKCPKCKVEFVPPRSVISDIDISSGVAAISAEPITEQDIIEMFDTISGQIHMLYLCMKPHNPSITEEAIDKAFGPLVVDAMNELRVGSGYVPEGGSGDPGENPTPSRMISIEQ